MEYDVTNLSSKTIGMFAEYVPAELLDDIDNENYFGWGYSLDGDVVACGVFRRSDDEVEILWLYVDPELRQLGIARRLLDSAVFETDVNAFVCHYLMPSHQLFSDFLRHEGFYVKQDHSLEDESVLGGERLFIGMRGEKFDLEESPEDELLFVNPDMAYVIPRFKQLEYFFDDNGYDANSVYEGRSLPYLEIDREGTSYRFFIMPDNDSEDEETFFIAARSSIDVSDSDSGKVSDVLDVWSEDHPVMGAEYDEENRMIDFFAAFAPDGGMPEDAVIGSFVETVISDVEAFYDAVKARE